MLYLYPKNTIDFTNNGDPIYHSYDEHVVRDDGFYLTFNLLLDKEEGYKKVKKEMIVSADTPDGINQFRIYDIKNKNTVVEVTAVQLMYDFDNKEVNSFSLKNSTGSQVISRFKSSFKSTLGQFTMDSSVTETHDFATNNEDDDTPSHNALEVLNRITNRWDSELMLNGFDIRMIKRLGAKTDALLYEKKNISEFEDASSVSGIITRIHATSKFTPEGKEDEVILSVTVDSPLINEYAQIYEKSYVNNDCRTEAELIAWTKLKYSTENVDKPSRSITVSTNIIDGTEINYGDDLVLKYLVHDVDEIIRCVGYDYDPIKNTYYSVTLGDWKDSFATTLTGGIVDKTNQQLNQIKNNITYISMSANGKNRNAYGPEPVPNPINGDNWYYYEFDRPNDVELRIFQDGFWVAIDFATKKEVEAVLEQADLDRIKAEQEINQAFTDAKNYTEVKAQEFDNKLVVVNQNVTTINNVANAAVSKADQAIQDVGFLQVDVNTAKGNAATALSTAQISLSNSGTALTNAQSALDAYNNLDISTQNLVLNSKQNISTSAYQIAEYVMSEDWIVDQEYTVTIKGDVNEGNHFRVFFNAGYSAFLPSVYDAKKGLWVITGKVSSGLDTRPEKNMLRVYNTPTTSRVSATIEWIQVVKGNSVLNGWSPNPQDVQIQITNINGEIATKVSQTTFNTLSETVGAHTTQISQTQSALLAKAESTLVNTIKGTVDSHSTQIKVVSDGLEVKADSSLVNTVKGTVDSHSLLISANSQAITARLTSTQIESLLIGKQYVNQTTLAATSNGLTAQITQVSTDLSSLEIEGRNYFNPTTNPIVKSGGGTFTVNDNVPYGFYAVGDQAQTLQARLNNVITGNGLWTVSFDLKGSQNGGGAVRVDVCDGTVSQIQTPINNEYSRFSITVNVTNYGDGTVYHFVDFKATWSYIWVKNIKVEKGGKATGFTLAPDDMVTLEKVVTIEANIDGINTLVASKASQTQVTQLAGQISTKVESSTYTSKMTQIDNAIDLRVVQSDVTEAILADKTIKDTRDANETPIWYLGNYPKQEVREFKRRTSLGLQGSSTYVQVTTKVPWAGGTSGGVPVQIAESNDGTYQRVSNSTGSAWLAWDKIAEAGKLISQINISTEGILLQGKRIQLDGDVTMTSAFVTDIKAKSLEAVYADIATLKTRLLTADVITSTMIKSDLALIDKLFATDANVQRLTAKTAFINSVKAVDIAADKVTGGTFNGATMNVINLNANSMTSGTLNGANYSNNLNTGVERFTNPSTGDVLTLSQGKIEFNNGSQSRYLNYNAEGLQLVPGARNTGTSKNTSLHLIGGGGGSYQYLQFLSGAGISQRIEAYQYDMNIYHAAGGKMHVKSYGGDDHSGVIRAARFETSDSTGNTLEMDGDQIRTPSDGRARNIFITPNGIGAVIAGASGGLRYNVNASDFVKQSSRTTKTNIMPLTEGLGLINRLTPVSYNKIDKLNQGIIELEKGFISEDSFGVSTPDGKGVYDSHITAHLVKAVQELDVRTADETDRLKEEIRQLKTRIKKLESAA